MEWQDIHRESKGEIQLRFYCVHIGEVYSKTMKDDIYLLLLLPAVYFVVRGEVCKSQIKRERLFPYSISDIYLLVLLG